MVLGGGFEPTYLAIISRVPIPNWRPQYMYQESVRVLSLNFNLPMSREREVRLNFLGFNCWQEKKVSDPLPLVLETNPGPAEFKALLLCVGGRGGCRPHYPERMVLQTTAFADSLLSHINDHQSLFTLVPCYLVVWLGDWFTLLSPSESLSMNEGVVCHRRVELRTP